MKPEHFKSAFRRRLKTVINAYISACGFEEEVAEARKREDKLIEWVIAEMEGSLSAPLWDGGDR
jgi:hypothetical protein